MDDWMTFSIFQKFGLTVLLKHSLMLCSQFDLAFPSLAKKTVAGLNVELIKKKLIL